MEIKLETKNKKNTLKYNVLKYLTLNLFLSQGRSKKKSKMLSRR